MFSRVSIQNIETINVLHIDDDPTHFDFTKIFLNKIDPNLKITYTNNPEKAIQQLDTHQYHCIVTDYSMPGMTGIELATKIRQHHQIPIILYTGHGSEKVAEKAFQAGVDDYIRKELDPSHYKILAKRIRNVVDKKQLEVLYQDLMDQTHFGITILQKNQIVFANNSAAELLDKNHIDELMDQTPFPDKTYTELGDHEYVYKTEKGETRVLGISNREINYNGNPAIFGVFWDATEKHHLKIRNKTSQERFKALVELSPDGVATFNTHGYMTFHNQAFSNLTGFTKEELIGKHITSLKTLRKRDLIKYLRSFVSILRGEASPPMEFTYNRKDSSQGVGESHIALIELNGIKEILLIARDITESKKNEVNYTTLFKKSSTGLIELDDEKKIVNINKTVTRQTGYNEETYTGHKLHTHPIFKHEAKNIIEKAFRTVEQNKTTITFDLPITTKTNKETWMRAHITPTLFDNNILGYQITINDISKRKQGEQKHRKNIEHLEKLVEQKTREIINNERLVAAGKTASMIGHDLRTPLQNIKNLTYLLQKKFDDPLLAKLENQVTYSVELLKRFEDKTKTTQIDPMKHTVHNLLEKAVATYDFRENISVIKSIQPDIPPVWIDEFQFRRVLINLINNAVQAMPEGGKLALTAEVEKNMMIISVSDTGKGITEENLEKIFEPFYTTKSRGIGLGLSFCRRIVEAHNGTIEAISEQGIGTTINILLPLNQKRKEENNAKPYIGKNTTKPT